MATMIQTAAFLPYILPKAPGVTVLMAEFQARQAAAEFCARTRIWRETFVQDMTTNGPTIITPDYAAIHDIDRAQFTPTGAEPGPYLTPVAFSDLPPAWATEAEGPPACITQMVPNSVILYPFQPGTLTITVYLKPRSGQNYTLSGTPLTDYFNQVPDFLAEQHAEKIASGALARILALPKKPYTDLNMAAVYAQSFNNACDSLFSINRTGQQRAPRRVRYNDF